LKGISKYDCPRNCPLNVYSWLTSTIRDASSKGHQTFITFAMLATVRVIRAWNQTGQKFAGEPDIVKTFVYPSPGVLWFLVGATYIWLHREIVFGFNHIFAPISYACGTGMILAAVTFKVAFTKEDAPELVVGFVRSIADIGFSQGHTLIARARAAFVALGAGLVVAIFYILTRRRLSYLSPSIETLHQLYTLLAVTQSRITNIPLFLLFHLQYKLLDALNLSALDLSTSSLLLQYASFFAFGGSNAISSVDLSNAYNGVSDFNVATVGLLTFVSNWAAPIYWTFATTMLLLRKAWKEETAWSVYRGHVAVLTLFTTCSVAAVMAACTILRTHLFIWTVFSPKYLYCIAWSLGQHLMVNVVVGGVVFWLGSL
jgi:ethanolaminephosphotransferase